MALFNKFFINRKQFPYKSKQQQEQNTSEKLFTVGIDNVRLVLFKECDFRGRKLLFDSSVVKKVALDDRDTKEKFVEVSNGFGYMYSKAQADTSQLAEMVFGSVAMSFRGTYFKIHCLNDPQRLMFTQVFPSPRNNGRRNSKNNSNNWSDPRISSTKSLEHSMKLDDSGASSTNSMSEQLSVYSTVSDTILVCKRQQSTPLDVPYLKTNSTSSNKSLVVDSGCTEPSSSSFSSGPNSIPFWESMMPSTIHLSNVSLSSGSLYKRLLRSTSTSLDQSISSLTSVSIDECFPKHQRSSKLGLAFIIDLPTEQEEYLTTFLMEHIALVESMIWRTRHAVESAYTRPITFVSTMMDITLSCTKWLVSVLSVPSFLVSNMWRLLSIGCDRNRNSINNFNSNSSNFYLDFNDGDKLWRTTSVSFLDDFKEVQCRSLNSSFSGFSITNFDRPSFREFQFFNKFLRHGSTSSSTSSLSKSQEELNNSIGRFLKEFCEIVETIDVKDKNFFMSTLLTAVLTHHLGWVATCLPPSTEDYEFRDKFHSPFNSLWSQLSDLYGAVGHPVKMAQTIISGSNKSTIPKIINSLSYFIRCTDIERKFIQRTNVDEENKVIEDVFKQKGCIPKDYYKKYEDHLKEIMTDENVPIEKQNKLGKTRTIAKNLSNLEEVSENLDCGFNFYSTEEQNDKEVDGCTKDKVIFVLGDNEELVDLKRNEKEEKEKEIKKRPSYLNLSQTKFECSDSDFTIIKTDDPLQLKPSSSWTSKKFADVSDKNLDRAQSEPPEDRTNKPIEVKAKYKYSGVKFNLQQYPQVVTNYMKSKNLEIANLPFGPKYTKLEDLSSGSNTTKNIHFDLCNYENDSDEMEALQTPSNASELEFTSDLCTEMQHPQTAKESTHEPLKPCSGFIKKSLPNTVIKEYNGEKKVRRSSKDDGSTRTTDIYKQKLKIINLPMPKSTCSDSQNKSIPYTLTLMRGIVDNYLPGMVLQGLTVPKNEWEYLLKSDLSLTSQHSLVDQPVEEAVAIIANTDTWEVQLVSSHTYVIDKGTAGVRIGMSQFVANMLESLLHLWKLNVPPYYCLLYIERKLQELCLRSKALAQFLLSKEFCNMEILTSTLHLEVNDVPLLMAIASTHSPQVTEKYGLSFQ